MAPVLLNPSRFGGGGGGAGGGGAGGWTNHVAIYAPGATSHTFDPANPTAQAGATVEDGAAFTPTAGRLLVCFVGAAVTTSTPTGWTLPAGGSIVSTDGLYAFYKTAAGSDTLGPVSHNASTYPVTFDFYEFASTYAFAAVTAAHLGSGSAQTLSGLTGTNIVLTSVVGPTLAGTWAFTNATPEYDKNYAPTAHHYAAAYTTGVTASSLSVAATLEAHEQIMFAVK